MRDFLTALGGRDTAQESVLAVTFTNGSRILALPGREATIRGYAADLVLVDEAARVPDATIDAVRPMLSVTGGQLVLLSTPWGRRGRFFEAWSAGGPAWERTEARADQCPRLSPKWLAEERRALPARIYRQEYECSFEDVEDQVFATEDIRSALTDVPPLFDGPLFRRGAA